MLQVYFSSCPLKVFNLRPDTLATMTCLADIGPHARVLCLDATGGVAAAACAERMGGTGTLACVHAERVPYVLDAMRLLNAPRWLAPTARSIALVDLLAAHARSAAAAALAPDATATAASDAAQPAADAPHPPAQPSTQPEAAPAAAPEATAAAAESGSAAGAEGGFKHKTVFRLHEPVAEGTRVPDAVIAATAAETAGVATRGFTALVLAAPRLEPALLLQAVQPLLLPSAAVVVFSPALQPLADCFHTLQESREYASIQVRTTHSFAATPSHAPLQQRRVVCVM